MVALVDQHGGGLAEAHRTGNSLALGVVDRDGAVRQHCPVTILQIGDAIGEGRQRYGIAAYEHFTASVPDGERRAVAGRDQQVVLALEQDGERKGALQPGQNGLDGLLRRLAAPYLTRQQLCDDLGVRLGGEHGAIGDELILQHTEVLDDAVVHHDHVTHGMRMRIGLRHAAMGGPARVTDARRSSQWLARQQARKVLELADSPTSLDTIMRERRHACGIIAAVFQPPQRLDDVVRHGLLAENADDTAHVIYPICSCARPCGPPSSRDSAWPSLHEDRVRRGKLPAHQPEHSG